MVVASVVVLLSVASGVEAGVTGSSEIVRVNDDRSSLLTNLKIGWKIYTPPMKPAITAKVKFEKEIPRRRLFFNISLI